MSGEIVTRGFTCVASGHSASMNSTTFWVCEECGAALVTRPATSHYIGDTSLQIHRDWHARLPVPVKDKQ